MTSTDTVMDPISPPTAIDDATYAQLLDYLKELEGNVERQAQELRASEQRYRELFETEQKRSSELALFTVVGETAQSHRTVDEYVAAAARAIQSNFSYYDVAIFLADDSAGEVVLRSQSGGYRHSLPLGYRQKIGVGIIGWVAEHGETLLSNDVSQEPRFLCAFPAEEATRSELAVPIKMNNMVRGVIDVQSQSENAFDFRDVVVLQTVADQMATAIENTRLYQQTLLLKEFNETVIASFPSAIIVINHDRRIVMANRTFCSQSGLPEIEVEGRSLEEILDPAFLESTGLVASIERMFETGEAMDIGDVLYVTPTNEQRVTDIRMSFLSYSDETLLLITIRDVTARTRRVAQMSLLHSMGSLMQRTLDLDHVLFTILTCITAGPALGFNRGFVLLLDKEKQNLEGVMAIGPASPEEANRIWWEVGQHYRNLDDLVGTFQPDQIQGNPLQQQIEQVRLAVPSTEPMILWRVIQEKMPFKVSMEAVSANLCYPYGDILQAREFVVAPLVAGNEVLGVVLADNVYNGNPIDDEDLRLLTTLCNQAGLAIANAIAHENVESHAQELSRAYERLKEAHLELERTAKLAAVGEMAARVSHEIKNPLATIGGFARSMLKKPDDTDRVRHDAAIIMEEVEELEGILRNMLDLTRPGLITPRPESINTAVEHACLMARADLEKYKVTLRKELDSNIPEAFMDARQVEQTALNVIRNGIQSMPDGGELVVSTRGDGDWVVWSVADRGSGIPEDKLQQIYTPFYTTKVQGTGLGLAVTKKIIDDHHGEIEVVSAVGRGTTFTVRIPLIQPPVPDGTPGALDELVRGYMER